MGQVFITVGKVRILIVGFPTSQGCSGPGIEGSSPLGLSPPPRPQAACRQLSVVQRPPWPHLVKRFREKNQKVLRPQLRGNQIFLSEQHLRRLWPTSRCLYLNTFH